MCCAGRGLKVAHSFGDLLWSLGPKIVPYPSFKLERIMPYVSPLPWAASTPWFCCLLLLPQHGCCCQVPLAFPIS